MLTIIIEVLSLTIINQTTSLIKTTVLKNVHY